MTASHPVAAEDLEAMRAWFARLNAQVNSLDFADGRRSITDDYVGFGTFKDFIVGIDDAEQNQWRNVWPTIKDFRIRLDDVRGFVSPDRLLGVGITFFDSVGFHEDGSTFPRSGRVTMSFVREKIGEPWLANHGHMSLMRGTPMRSHGNKPA